MSAAEAYEEAGIQATRFICHFFCLHLMCKQKLNPTKPARCVCLRCVEVHEKGPSCLECFLNSLEMHRKTGKNGIRDHFSYDTLLSVAGVDAPLVLTPSHPNSEVLVVKLAVAAQSIESPHAHEKSVRWRKKLFVPSLKFFGLPLKTSVCDCLARTLELLVFTATVLHRRASVARRPPPPTES